MGGQCRYPYRACYVYGLVDPRTDQIFYVGKTVQLRGRYDSHCHDRCSSAYPRLREILGSGHEPEMRILGTFRTEDAALDYEYRLIHSMKGLLNRSPGRDPNMKFMEAPTHSYIPLEEFEVPDRHVDDEDILWEGTV